MARKKGQKGSYGRQRLPVSKDYQRPVSRRQGMLFGGLAVLAVLLYFGYDFVVRQGRALSNGPLSSSHANLGDDCAACHVTTASVTDNKCNDCHEKFGDDLGVFSFTAHYLYRTNDFTRDVPSPDETPCLACHPEHLGREASLIHVPDRRCIDCHAYTPFVRNHPEMAFVTENQRDDTTLAFPHIQHVREIMKKKQLADMEKACLYCHNATEDGKHFKPISFDEHCDACHLTSTSKTPRLTIRSGDNPIGVETVAQMKRRPSPGTLWAAFANPSEYRVTGDTVFKSPLHHADPWVMENLRLLRSRLYEDTEMADLLRASADIPFDRQRELYQEALNSLEDAAIGLRSRPEPDVQDELARIEENIAEIKRQLRDPYAPLDETRFLLTLEKPNASLSEEDREEIDLAVADLTEACRQCHQVERATIGRVRKDLRRLDRAEFNHRDHILQAPCLDCHSAIPFAEYVPAEGKVDPSLDSSAIINLPTMENCRQCHQPKLASERCITCHEFHPNKNRRSHLLFYLD